MAEVLGYVVLTKQPDGSWRDDWDGVVHVEAHKGVLAFENARKAIGSPNVRFGKVVDFFDFTPGRQVKNNDGNQPNKKGSE